MKGWLKHIAVESNKPKHSIIEVLVNQLEGAEKGRSRSTLHASDLTKEDFCPRREALLDINGVTHGEPQYIPAALRTTFDLGNATAEVLISKWARNHVVGNWECRVCGAQRTFSKYPGFAACNDNVQKACHWEYREYRVISPLHGTSGSMDVLFDVGAPLLMIVELKTIAAEEFASIVSPLPEHRLRTNLYLRLWAESNDAYRNRVNLHEGRVLYVSRGYGKKNEEHGGKIIPFKEYAVHRNDDDLAGLLVKAHQLKAFRAEGKMPSGICGTALEKRAKSCSQCVLCFSGLHPAQQPPL